MPQQPEGRRVYLAGPPYAEEYRRRAEGLVRAFGWELVDPMRRDYRGRTEGNEKEIVEGDLAEKLSRWLPHIGHIQIAGVPGRHEPDNGEINYRYLLSLLDELGYDGWVGCEYRPANGTVQGLGWMKTAVARR